MITEQISILIIQIHIGKAGMTEIVTIEILQRKEILKLKIGMAVL